MSHTMMAVFSGAHSTAFSTFAKAPPSLDCRDLSFNRNGSPTPRGSVPAPTTNAINPTKARHIAFFIALS
jgi:hypothetical protein